MTLNKIEHEVVMQKHIELKSKIDDHVVFLAKHYKREENEVLAWLTTSESKLKHNFSKTARFYNLEGMHTCMHAHTCYFMFLLSLKKSQMRLNTYRQRNQTSASLATKDTS